ncbi:hypothetical protein HJC23_004593 [Cyclotella cryptica]|uniref:Solute-binding protein family 3/N-terminal domain-containing protein n=1 Tax=Cyclotella cryptica TaxID=29204 RepID=A0ABD3QF35_9STRA
MNVDIFVDNEANTTDGAVAVPATLPSLSVRSSERQATVADRNAGDGNNVNNAQTGDASIRSTSNVMLGGQNMMASVRRVNSIFFSSLSRSGLTRSLPSQEGSLNNSQIQNSSNQRRQSSPFFSLSNVFINASLVEENESNVVVDAEPIGFCHKHGKVIATLSFLVLVAFVTIMTLTLKRIIEARNMSLPSPVPSFAPSLAPSYDPRPTLEIVQERGTLRCGLVSFQFEGTFCFKLCQAIAAVALNNPDAVDSVNATAEARFVLLKERATDLHAGGATHTIEREVNEGTTGSPFTFSTPFYYDGMVFAGNATFVTCAEEQRRFNECSRLFICVAKSTTDLEYVSNHFTPSLFVTTASMTESIEFYSNDRCNVVAGSRLGLFNLKYTNDNLLDESFVIGDKTFNNDPLAFATRPDDPEWSRIINWVAQVLFFGERQEITKNLTLCQNSSGTFNASWTELNYLNAVYCVGNYAEIYSSSQLAKYDRQTINTINNGTAMLYAIPNGNLRNDNEITFYSLSETFSSIKRRGSLNCGLLIQDGYSEDDITASKRLFGMGVSYCETLVSSMLHGNMYAVNFIAFQNAEISLEALYNKTIDVLVGVPADMSRNFGSHSFEGVSFSTPYFYGNQTGK